MPTIITIGGASARGFGLTASKREPPGSITYNNGYTGPSYQPIGYTKVTVTCRGSRGTNSGYGGSGVYQDAGNGSVATNNNVPVANLMIYCPSGVRQSQWSGGGSGGTGATVTVSAYNGLAGGAVCAATWTGGLLVAAGGGGSASFNTSSAPSRYGGYEGSGSALGDNAYPPFNSNGTSSPPIGACYYGGGGGGGGYSLGGGAGSHRNGGRAGGNGATPTTTGPGSYGYTSLSTTSTTSGFAVVSWP